VDDDEDWLKAWQARPSPQPLEPLVELPARQTRDLVANGSERGKSR